jgi:hypothetical protein
VARNLPDATSDSKMIESFERSLKERRRFYNAIFVQRSLYPSILFLTAISWRM